MAVQAYLGLRIGEAVAVQVQDVEWLRGRLTVCRQWDEPAREPVSRLKGRKADSKPRTIELPETLKVALAEHVRKYPSDGLLFTASQGGQVLPGTYRSRVFKPALRRAGLDPSIRTHDLRHTFGSVLIREGWSAPEVAEVLGNSPEVVLRTYAHVVEDRRRSLAQTIDAACVVRRVTDDAASL